MKSVRIATNKEWDDAWGECDYATYFHSREWAEVWNVSSKDKVRPEPRLILFKDGRTAVVPLSYTLKNRDSQKEYITSPGWTYGGWVSNCELTSEHAQKITKYLLEKCGNLWWRRNPYDKCGSAVEAESTADETQVLDLSPGMDEVLGKFGKSNLQVIRKAQKHGIQIKPAMELDHWRDYFKIYEESRARWGDAAGHFYDWGFFEELFRRHSSFMNLWLAWYDNKIIAGALTFYAKRHAVGWHMTTAADFMSYSPANLLNYEIVKDACIKGYPVFDFNPSGGHKGVVEWKKKFGTDSVSCPVVRVRRQNSTVYGKIMSILRK